MRAALVLIGEHDEIAATIIENSNTADPVAIAAAIKEIVDPSSQKMKTAPPPITKYVAKLKKFSGIWVVDQGAETPISKHLLPKIIKTAPTCEPPRRSDHAEIAWLDPFGGLYELLVDRHRKATDGLATALSKLVRRISHDYVELHVGSKQLGQPSFYVVGVNERIGVGLESVAAVIVSLIGTAILAPAVHPCVLYAREPDVAIVVGKALRNRVRALGMLRAIHAPSRKQAGEMRDANAEHLLCQDVSDALLKVWASPLPSPW